MALSPEDQKRLTRATELALEWHAGQNRKGSDIPYFSHLAQVMGLVLEHGGDVDQAVAGALHDALEDAEEASERGEREAAIAAEFGERVLAMVQSCTDTEPGDSLREKAPWRERKESYIAHLERVSSDPEAGSRDCLLVAACDKRHNLQALVSDLHEHGLRYLDRFDPQSDQHWYYKEVLCALEGMIPPRLQRELDTLLRELTALMAGVD